MSVQIFGKGKKVALQRRHARLRKRISGTPELPRLVVTRSNRHMVAQIIDDTKGITLVSESTLMSDFAGFEGTKTEGRRTDCQEGSGRRHHRGCVRSWRQQVSWPRRSCR